MIRFLISVNVHSVNLWSKKKKNHRNIKYVVLFLITSLFFLGGCTPSENSIQTAIAQTQEFASNLSNSGEMTSPTMTTKPENTKEPTAIPATPTKEPSSTPEPTLAPDPIELTGIGDMVVDIDWPKSLGLLIVNANSADKHFAIVPYEENGNRLSSLVNTTDPYYGSVPFNFNGDYITRLEVSAVGDWSLEIVPVHEANEFTLPGTFNGSNDDVIILTNGIPDLATISANSQSHHFAVVPYTNFGKRMSSVVNTTDPYEGTVIIPRDTVFLVIHAIGDWQISIITVE